MRGAGFTASSGGAAGEGVAAVISRGTVLSLWQHARLCMRCWRESRGKGGFPSPLSFNCNTARSYWFDPIAKVWDTPEEDEAWKDL